MWSLVLCADDKYPISPPKIKFTSKISADFVDGRGNVLPAKVPALAAWNPAKSMMTALIDIKSLIARAPRSQPAEGSKF